MPHFLIMYRPPRATFGDDMTEAEEKVIGRHAQYLRSQCDKGRLVMAGPVEDARFGLALLETDTEAQARQIMENDPAVVEGVFTGELMPFRLSISR